MIVLNTANGQTLTVVKGRGRQPLTLRIAKDGHNRGIAKLNAADRKRLARFLLAMNNADDE